MDREAVAIGRGRLAKSARREPSGARLRAAGPDATDASAPASIPATPRASSAFVGPDTAADASTLPAVADPRPAAALRPLDVAYATAKRRILMNELVPGTVLTELGLARELAVSQGTVREALLRLQEDGLVIRSRHRGTTVTSLEPGTIAEVVSLRRHLETRAAPRAVLHAGPADDARLGSLFTEMTATAAAGEAYRLMELDTALHMGLFRLAGFQVLEQILLRCILHSHRSKLWAPGHRRPLAETAARHGAILDAFRARDGTRLADVLGRHIDTIVDLGESR